MNPDELIENATNGNLSIDEDLLRFEKSIDFSVTAHIYLKRFFTFYNIPITLPYPKYKSRSSIKEITTEQIQKMCNIAPLKTKSWIIA